MERKLQTCREDAAAKRQANPAPGWVPLLSTLLRLQRPWLAIEAEAKAKAAEPPPPLPYGVAWHVLDQEARVRDKLERADTCCVETHTSEAQCVRRDDGPSLEEAIARVPAAVRRDWERDRGRGE